MGEGLLGNMLPERRLASAGIAALTGEPADEYAVQIMAERGIDLTAHRGRQIDRQMVVDSDLVLVMEHSQREWIEGRWPETRGRVYRWGHWSDFDVPDPYNGPESAFREALKLLDTGLAQWRDRL